jgi:hypothetical protein
MSFGRDHFVYIRCDSLDIEAKPSFLIVDSFSILVQHNARLAQWDSVDVENDSAMGRDAPIATTTWVTKLVPTTSPNYLSWVSPPSYLTTNANESPTSLGLPKGGMLACCRIFRKNSNMKNDR